MRHRRMLRRLSSGLGLLPVFINILLVADPVETHAAELHGGTIDRMVARHDHGLLLIQDPTLEARRTARSARRTIRVRGVATQRRPWRGKLADARIGRTGPGGTNLGSCNRAGLRVADGRNRRIQDLLDVRLRQLVLGWLQDHFWFARFGQRGGWIRRGVNRICGKWRRWRRWKGFGLRLRHLCWRTVILGR